MKSIEDVVTVIEDWSPARSKDRERLLGCLDALSSNCGEAIKVWQGYLDNPGAGGNQWTAVSWIGPERAKRLHELNLRSGELLHELLEIAGSEAARFHPYEDSMIEMAYRQLGAGETAPDMARAAVERMGAHRSYLGSVLDRIKSMPLVESRTARSASSPRPKTKKKSHVGKPKKGTAAGAKKAVKKKAVKKKAAKKVAKAAGKKPVRRSKQPPTGRTKRRR
ncbi:MAG: hypothetical protein M0Z84_11180 [Gammaproteobacteria bacterium]|nr:hypothetical protein [Gammaproteobacteria bacterium]